MSTDASPVHHEVTDEELEEEAARVRRHAWRERGAMGLAIVAGFGGIGAWLATGWVVLFVGSLFVGAAIYKGLAPRGGPLDDPPGSLDPEARAMAKRIDRGGPLAWLAGRFLKEVVTAVGLVVGLFLGMYGLGGVLVEALHDVRGLIYAAAIGAIAGAILGWIAGRALVNRLIGPTANPFA